MQFFNEVPWLKYTPFCMNCKLWKEGIYVKFVGFTLSSTPKQWSLICDIGSLIY